MVGYGELLLTVVCGVCCTRPRRVVWFAGKTRHDDAATCRDVPNSDAETSAAAAAAAAAAGDIVTTSSWQ